MSTVGIVVLALFGAIALLTLIGAAGATRRRRAGHERFHASLGEVDRALATALADDRGWEPAGLEAAARGEFAQRRPGASIEQLELIQVIDRPGTDDDLAVFRILVAGASPAQLTLGRRGGEWYGIELVGGPPA
jgi:hypothetical protein